MKPDAVLVGENWTDTQHHRRPTTAPPRPSRAATSCRSTSTSRSPTPDHRAASGQASATGDRRQARRDEAHLPGRRHRRALPHQPRHAPGGLASSKDDPGRLRQRGRRPAHAARARRSSTTARRWGSRTGPPTTTSAKRTPMPWDATPGGGFTTGTPWYRFAPGARDGQRRGPDRRPRLAALPLPEAHPGPARLARAGPRRALAPLPARGRSSHLSAPMGWSGSSWSTTWEPSRSGICCTSRRRGLPRSSRPRGRRSRSGEGRRWWSFRLTEARFTGSTEPKDSLAFGPPRGLAVLHLRIGNVDKLAWRQRRGTGSCSDRRHFGRHGWSWRRQRPPAAAGARRPRLPPRTRAGGATGWSTRSSSAASPTRTATASAT